MTRDELIAALQSQPRNVEVLDEEGYAIEEVVYEKGRIYIVFEEEDEGEGEDEPEGDIIDVEAKAV